SWRSGLGERHSRQASHCRSAGAVASRESSVPQRHTQPRWRAGVPATSWWGRTSWVTVAPAATIEYRPRELPHTMVALAPIDAPSATAVRVMTQSGLNARGTRSLVKVADG